MSLKNHITTISACTTICLNVSAGEAIPIVTRGETLSTILYDLNLKPIYGKNKTFNSK